MVFHQGELADRLFHIKFIKWRLDFGFAKTGKHAVLLIQIGGLDFQ